MEKYRQFIKKFFDGNENVEEKPINVKYPFLQIILEPYLFSLDNFKKIVRISAVYALLLSIVYVLGSQHVFCMFSEYRTNGEYCTGSLLLFIIVHLIAFVLMSSFAYRWYNACFNDYPINIKWLLRPSVQDIKAVISFLIFILLNAISLLSYFLLAIRVPNPDWRIELIYFAIISIGFLVPFILTRFYSIIAFILSQEKIPPLTEIWKKSSGNGLRVLLSLIIYFMCCVFSLSAYTRSINLPSMENSFFFIFAGEYFFNFISLLLISVFVNLCYLQKHLLFGEQDHGTNK